MREAYLTVESESMLVAFKQVSGWPLYIPPLAIEAGMVVSSMNEGRWAGFGGGCGCRWGLDQKEGVLRRVRGLLWIFWCFIV